MIMSLKPNLHASGITVILESIILGVPVVCTDSGGLVLTFPPLRSTKCLHMLRSRCGLRLKNWPKMTNDAGIW
jgi:hypothetical protein